MYKFFSQVATRNTIFDYYDQIFGTRSDECYLGAGKIVAFILLVL